MTGGTTVLSGRQKTPNFVRHLRQEIEIRSWLLLAMVILFTKQGHRNVKNIFGDQPMLWA
jgi:hypothetical protein